MAAEKLTAAWLDQAVDEAWSEARRRIRLRDEQDKLKAYQRDPIGFTDELLGEAHVPTMLKRVMTSVRDNPVTVARSSNDVGKSWSAARLAIWWYKCFPGSQVYVTAAPPLDNLRRVLWGEIMSVVQNKTWLFENDKIRTLTISRGPLSFISGVAIPTSGTSEEREAKFSGKHAPYLMFIVDEGDAVPDEVYRGIESCMSGGMARLLVLFNPRAKAGPVWLRERDRTANIVELSAMEHPNVTSGEDLIPGAVTRDTTVRRVNQWTRPMATEEKPDNTFEVPEFLVGATAKSLSGEVYPPLMPGLRKVEEPAFWYMVLGEYPPQGENTLISEAWLFAARTRWDTYVSLYGERPPAGVTPILAIDIAEMGTDYNVACLRYGGYVARLKLWNGMDPDASAQRAMALYREHGAHLAMIDGTGIGSSVAPSMARQGRDDNIRAVSVKVSEKPSPFIKSELGEFKRLRDQLWWATREWLRTDPGAMLPPDPMLVEELRLPTYEVRNGDIVVMTKEKMRDLLRRSPDRADALVLSHAPFERAKVMRLVV